MSTKNKHFMNIFNFLKICFFPKKCIFCFNWFEENGLVCKKCLKRICQMDRRKRKCKICDSEIDLKWADTCSFCQNCTPSFSSNLSAMNYNDALGKLIHSVKFGQHREGCNDLSDIMNRLLPELNIENTILSWIPLSRRRRLQRGFNQAEEIGKLFAKKRNIITLSVLKRVVNTKPQARLTTEKRRENIEGAFIPVNNKKWKGKNIILVDDVITSGATAQAASKVLKKYGAKGVKIITVGRA